MVPGLRRRAGHGGTFRDLSWGEPRFPRLQPPPGGRAGGARVKALRPRRERRFLLRQRSDRRLRSRLGKRHPRPISGPGPVEGDWAGTAPTTEAVCWLNSVSAAGIQQTRCAAPQTLLPQLRTPAALAALVWNRLLGLASFSECQSLRAAERPSREGFLKTEVSVVLVCGRFWRLPPVDCHSAPSLSGAGCSASGDQGLTQSSTDTARGTEGRSRGRLQLQPEGERI